MRRIVVGVRAVVAVGVLAGVLAGGWVHTPDVRAAVASRGDPVFLLSGTSGGTAIAYRVQVGVSVSALSSQITSVTYVVHGPAGTVVTQQYATDDALAAKEVYTYAADRADQKFVAVTTVTTTGGSVAVTISESAASQSAGSTASTSLSQSGMSNQPITTTVSVGASSNKPLVNWGS
jgi:hypothetical protein